MAVTVTTTLRPQLRGRRPAPTGEGGGGRAWEGEGGHGCPAGPFATAPQQRVLASSTRPPAVAAISSMSRRGSTLPATRRRCFCLSLTCSTRLVCIRGGVTRPGLPHAMPPPPPPPPPPLRRRRRPGRQSRRSWAREGGGGGRMQRGRRGECACGEWRGGAGKCYCGCGRSDRAGCGQGGRRRTSNSRRRRAGLRPRRAPGGVFLSTSRCCWLWPRLFILFEASC